MAQMLALAAFRVWVDLAELRGLAGGETGFGGTLGEPAIIGQEPPNDACQAVRNDHQGVAVFFAFGAVLAVNAREVVRHDKVSGTNGTVALGSVRRLGLDELGGF